MQETRMDIIVNEGLDRVIYPGSTEVTVERALPDYRGGVTMHIIVQPTEIQPAAIPLTIDPELYGGVPSVGTGPWPISQILQRLAAGFYPDQLTQDYPGLTIADIQLALETASWVMREPSIDWTSPDLLEMTRLQKEMQDWQGLSDGAMELTQDE